MNCRYQIARFGGITLGLLAMSALAAPPFISNNTRTYGNEVYAYVCNENPDIQLTRCTDVYAAENYDVKGTYEYTDVWFYYSFHRVYDDGSWRQGTRWYSCQMGLDAIKKQGNHVTLNVVLDAYSPECDTWGTVENCEPMGPCVPEPWTHTEYGVVTGEWLDPINSSKVVVNRVDTYFDPWSETTQKIVNHCNEDWGDLMAQGGLFVQFGERVREFPFTGFDTQGWSAFWLRSCNENVKVK